MIRKISVFVAMLSCAGAAHAQTPIAPAPTTQSQAAPTIPPVIVKAYRADIQVTPAGLGTLTVHMELQATNAAAAQQIGQQPISYSDSMADLDVTEAYTLKPDGSKLTVAPSAIYTQAGQMASAPVLNDQKQKVIVFPSVGGGDTIVYTYVLREKTPYIPGQFFGGAPFSRMIPFDAVDYSVTLPKSMPLYVEVHDVEQRKQETSGNTVTWRWHYAAPEPLQQDTSVLSSFDRSPRILYSTLKTYDDFAHAFAPLATPKFAVTDKIQAQADKLTQGVSDRREIAKKLYEWVSLNIRYVGIEFGTGAIIPHDADSVLANGYGDCKDHVALFSALLKAKGIDSQMVLINLGNNYSLPGVGVIGELNHAITWIPELQTYADTTAGVAPFGVLPFEEYGKPVVHVVASGPAVHQTPILPYGEASQTITTTAHLDDQGDIIGDTKVATTGPFSLRLRQLGLVFQAQGPERTAVNFLHQTNTPGTANFIVSPPTEIAPDYAMDSTFSLGPFTQVNIGARLAMPSKFDLLGMTGNVLIGPENAQGATENDPTPCYSGTTVQDVTLSAPPGRHFQIAPPDASIKTANLSFVSRWTLSGDTLHVHREVMTKFDTALCSGPVRADMAHALKTIRDNFSLGFALAMDAAQVK